MGAVTAHRIDHARAEDFLRTLPDASVGLILTDPPYFRVKNLAWDRAWTDADRFVAWLGGIADEWARVLKPNGTLVCFASGSPSKSRGATLAARVECMLGERFNVIASPVWVKADAQGNGKHSVQDKSTKRAYFPQTERVVVCEHGGSDAYARGESAYTRKCDELRGFVFEPLRAYLDGERKRAGVDKVAVNVACGFSASPGGMASRHYFSRSQWWLPTEAHYAAMRALFNASGGDYLRREYDDLRREYEALRRPFDAEAGAHFTDVWTYPTVPGRKGKHPCEKPADMARDLVLQCSRPGDVVLDTFCGSGVFLRAAAEQGRTAWGCDADEWWAAKTRQAIGAAAPPRPAETPVPALAPQPAQLDLFGVAS